MKACNKPFVSAVIPAAGQGTRMKSSVNKQYLSLQGKPVLSHTLDVFEACGFIDEVLVVINPSEHRIFKKEILLSGKYKKVKAVDGGDSRQASVKNGLDALSPSSDYVLIHDGARPLISEALLLACLEETVRFGATVVGVPAKNTIKTVDAEGIVTATPDRSTLMEIQTPQTFRTELAVRAHAQAIQDGFVGTDDASLVERLNVPVKVVRGSYHNLKITTPEDLIIMQTLLKQRTEK